MPKAHTLTVEEVRQWERDNALSGPLKEGEQRDNVTPYRAILDARNFWTAKQETTDLPAPPVTISPTGQSLTAAGGSGSFTVTMTVPGVGTWMVDQDSEDLLWCHLTSPPLHQPQSASGNVSYTVDANNTGNPRTTHFYTNGKTFTINQS